MNMTIWVVTKEVMGIDSDGYEFVKANEFDSVFSSRELAEEYIKHMNKCGYNGYCMEEATIDEYVRLK